MTSTDNLSEFTFSAMECGLLRLPANRDTREAGVFRDDLGHERPLSLAGSRRMSMPKVTAADVSDQAKLELINCLKRC